MEQMGTPEVTSGSRLVFVAGRERRARAVRSVGYGLAGLFAAYVAALGLSVVGAVHLQVPGLPPLPSPRPAPAFHVAVQPAPAGRGVVGEPVNTAGGGVTVGTGAPTYPGGPVTSPPISQVTATAIPVPTTMTTAATVVATTTPTTVPAAPYGAQPAATSTVPPAQSTASATTQANNGRSSTHPTPTSTVAPRSSTTLASHR